MDTKKIDGGLDNPTFVPDNFSKNATVEIDVDDIDIWKLPELRVDFTPWKELTTSQKVKRVFLHYILKTIGLLAALYIFICSLSFLGDAFKLLGGKTAGKAFSDSEILSNPVAGLMIGVLATVLLQSSSTTTSIIVSMVGSGFLEVRQAIPIMMGANIGTSVTNTIVSIGQIANKDDFRRAFAGATVHDVFNWLTVLVLLPLEVASGYLERFSKYLISSFELETNEDADKDYLKVITNPLTKLVIQIDKNVITKIATGELDPDDGSSIIKHECYDKVNVMVNGTEETQKINKRACQFMFQYITHEDRGDARWSDTAVGAILLVIALVLLCICLVLIVKTLHSLLRGQMAHVIRSFINAEFPGRWRYFTGYIAILIGAGLTILVQSSSIFTSSITPLVGMGVLSLDRMYPLTLGSNIGTTATGVLAAFAQDASNIPNSLQIALCHLFFNISGILLYYPLPFFRPPINGAKFLGVQTAKYRWFALVYLIICFFAFPAIVFGLSVLSWIAVAVVLIPLGLLLIAIFIVKMIQRKRPTALPLKFRTWKWLPLPLRSLEPYDRLFTMVTCHYICCSKLGCCKGLTEESDEKRVNYDADHELDLQHESVIGYDVMYNSPSAQSSKVDLSSMVNNEAHANGDIRKDSANSTRL